jgi:hypothetical protein
LKNEVKNCLGISQLEIQGEFVSVRRRISFGRTNPKRIVRGKTNHADAAQPIGRIAADLAHRCDRSTRQSSQQRRMLKSSDFHRMLARQLPAAAIRLCCNKL